MVFLGYGRFLMSEVPLYSCTESHLRAPEWRWRRAREREFFIDSLLVRIYFIIVMIRWTGLAPWEFEFPFPNAGGGAEDAVPGREAKQAPPVPRRTGLAQIAPPHLEVSVGTGVPRS